MRRIAFFVVDGWNDPIVVRNDGCTIKDALRRFKAAIYRCAPDVEINIDNNGGAEHALGARSPQRFFYPQ